MWTWCLVLTTLFSQTLGLFDIDSDDLSGSTVSVEMMSHSFGSPFRYDSSFPNWYVSGSVIQTRLFRLGLVMNPGISGRQGILWNKQLLRTNEFDTSVMLSFDDYVLGNTNSNIPAKDQHVGIFFSAANVSSILEKALKHVKTPDWSDAMIRAGIDPSMGVALVKGKFFDGVGVLISPIDERSGKRSPSVTVVAGDRRETAKLSSKESEFSSTQLSFLRFKIRIKPDSITVLYQEVADWRELLTVKNLKTIPKQGYLGITSFTGIENKNVAPFRTRVSSLHVKSYDLTAASDEAFFAKHGLSVKQLLDSSTYADPVAQTKVIKKLSDIMIDYLETTVPVYTQFREQITSLQKNVSEMDAFIAGLAKEAKYTFEASKGKEANRDVAALASEVKSIHAVLNQIERDRESVVDSVMDAQDELDHSGYPIDRHLGYYGQRINSRGEELDAMIESQNRFTLILLLLVVASAVGMGIAFYYRLNRYAEKAHLF